MADVILMLDGVGGDVYLRVQDIATNVLFEGRLNAIITQIQLGHYDKLIKKCVKQIKDSNGFYIIEVV